MCFIHLCTIINTALTRMYICTLMYYVHCTPIYYVKCVTALQGVLTYLGNNLQGTLPTAHKNLTLYIKPKFVLPPTEKFSNCAPA